MASWAAMSRSSRSPESRVSLRTANTEDAVLAALPGDLDYAFHLACFHGNQSSIADPLRDHDNNTPTGSGARTDGYEIRTAAVRAGIPCVTTMTGATAAARAIAAGKQGDIEVRSLQEIHAPQRAAQPR